MLEPFSQMLAAHKPHPGLVGVADRGCRRLTIHLRLIPQRLVQSFLAVRLDGFGHRVVHVPLVIHEDADSAVHVAVDGR